MSAKEEKEDKAGKADQSYAKLTVHEAVKDAWWYSPACHIEQSNAGGSGGPKEWLLPPSHMVIGSALGCILPQ
jgi:hypothetical protein